MRAKIGIVLWNNYLEKTESSSRSLLEHEIAPLHQFSELVFRTALGYQAGMSDKSIEDLARRLAEAVPEGLRSVRKDLEENFQSVLKSGLGKLDLVTREEFEVQEAVLARTREKLEALEARLKELEKDL
jgi:BMFP domain-containing protein YqiC